MVLKKITNIAFFTVICLLISACSGAETNNTANISDINADTQPLSLPFAEGYYACGDYTAKLIYIGNKSDISYGVSVFDNSNGRKVFLGFAYGVESGAESLDVPDSDGDTVLSLSKIDIQTDNLSIKCKGSDGLQLDNSYEYMGCDWVPQYEKDREVLCSGEYVNGEYTLSISAEGGVLKLSVSDGSGSVLFSGEKSCQNSVSSVVINDGGTSLQFTKVVNGDESYVEVFAYGYYAHLQFLGRFTPKVP